MIIGHLPAGYVYSKLLANKLSKTGVKHRDIILAGTLGGIAPDFDMLYFYLIDNRQHHHHTYWSHYPIVWLSLLLLFMTLFYLAKKKSIATLSIVFALGGILHLILDSIVGDVWWLAPFVDKPYALFTVPALYQPWWLNFILHWSFLLEMLVSLWAILLWKRKVPSAKVIV